MEMLQKRILNLSLLISGALLVSLTSCRKDVSSTTGWSYNDPRNGGFEVVPYEEQETGPGLVLVQGGRFTMGRTEQDINYDWDNVPRTVTVSSFYMDETEVRNIDYLEYLYWLKRVYDAEYPEVAIKALPDTNVWRDKLAFNEPMVEYYLRHPAYQQYPVVGVSWLQASDYCTWRTNRVNEMILIREGILTVDPNQTSDNNFDTDAYLAGQYEGAVRKDIPDLDPNKDTRKVRMEDGIFLPKYRLPTEAEWEYASLGLIGNTEFERVTERRMYPWNGHIVRNADSKYKGDILANFKKGRGDNMGIAGRLNDNADITGPVTSYWPNDYGLYNMAGNVAEWVMDVYRPLSLEDMSDFRPFRGNVYKKRLMNDDGTIADKDTLGRITFVDIDEKDALNRRNYRKSDNINYLDGDYESSIFYNDEAMQDSTDKLMYQYGRASMVNDHVRVYKGGSWKDRAYWLVAGTRRYYPEDMATDYIGFRCAMTRVGSPTGMGERVKDK
jgi:gliding motility-associated lipoprotein GldJ